MKKLLALTLALALLLCAAAALGEEFRVGMECNYAPYNWTQAEETETSVPIATGGYADGYDVQIAKRIAESLGRELVIVKTEWDGLTLSLTSGKIDAIIAGMSNTPERSVTIDFTDSYYESDLVIVVRGDSPYAGATSLADFAGAAITGQLNTFHYSVIPQIPEVKQQTALETFPAMIVALTSGRVDGYVCERPGALSAVMANPELTFVSFAEGEGFEASLEETSIAVGLAKGSDLLDPINEALAAISPEEREQIMIDAVANQPLSE